MFSAKRVLEFVIRAKDSSGPVWKNLGSRVKNLISDKKALATAAIAVGVAVAGMAVKVNAAYQRAIAKAGLFQKGTLEIITLLGRQNADVVSLSKELQELAVKYGQVDTVMAQARYNVVSAGFTDISDSMYILDVASRAAIAGVTDVNTAVTVITQTLNAYKLEASDADYVAGQLFATVKGGVTKFEDLAANLGKVTGIAHAANIGLDELSAAMAVLTKNGANTSEAATALNALILALGAASGESKDQLDAMGITLDEGLGPALAAIAKASQGSLEKLAELIPNIRAIRAAASAAEGGAEDFVRQLEAMTRGAEDFNEAYQIMSESYDQAVKRNEAATNRLAVAWGSTGLTGKAEALDGFTEAANHLAVAIEKDGGALGKLNQHLGRFVGNIARVEAYKLAPGESLFGISWSDLWPGAKKLNEELDKIPRGGFDALQVLQDLEAGVAVGGTGAPSPLGDPAGIVDTTMTDLKARFAAEASDLGVSLFATAFDPSTGRWVEVEKTMEELATELTAALNDTLNKEIAKAPVVPKDFDVAGYGGAQDSDGLQLLEDILAAEAEREGQLELSHAAEADRLMAEHDLLRVSAELADEHIASLQESETASDALRDAAIDVTTNFERLASNSLSAMFSASSGAIMFGRVLRTIVMDALSAVIAKLIIIKALGFIFSGGTSAAVGGHVASGFTPFGATIPGLTSATSAIQNASMVSPFSLESPGTGRTVVANLTVARPVGYLDVLDMGAAVVQTAYQVAEANL